MCPDALHRELLNRLEILEAAERQRRDQARRRARLLASAGKICPVVAVLGLAGWAVGQGVEIKTSDGAADQTRMKVETGAATVSAYFLNTLVGIGTNAPNKLLTAQFSNTNATFDEGIQIKDSTGANKWHWNLRKPAGATGLNLAESGVSDGRLFMAYGGNVGIGTITPDVRLTVASSTTAGDQALKIYSADDASIQLYADGDDDVAGEDDNPYLAFAQDGSTSPNALIGMCPNAGDLDPQNAAYTGTTVNSLLVGLRTARSVHLGTNSAVRVTVASDGSVHMTGGYANAAAAGAAGSAGFWFGDDTGAQTDPTFTIMEDSNDTRFINIGVGSAVGVIGTGAHDLHVKTGSSEGALNTGTVRMKVYDADGRVDVTSLRGFTISGGSTTNATFGAWPGNAAANTWLYLSTGDTATPAYSDLAVGDSYANGLSYHVGQSRFYTKGDTILCQPTSMASGEVMRIKFVDPDAGSQAGIVEYLDDATERLRFTLGTGSEFEIYDGGQGQFFGTTAGCVLGPGSWGPDNWLRLTTSVNGSTYHDLAVDNFYANGALRYDLAEVTPVDPADLLAPGELVAADPAAEGRLRKTRGAYEPAVLGIVTQPVTSCMTIGGGVDPSVIADRADLRTIALAGRVPTIVNLENGPVRIGDPIASSSARGAGMRAVRQGSIVGRALETFDGSRVNSPGVQAIVEQLRRELIPEKPESGDVPRPADAPEPPEYARIRRAIAQLTAPLPPGTGRIIVFVAPGSYVPDHDASGISRAAGDDDSDDCAAESGNPSAMRAEISALRETVEALRARVAGLETLEARLKALERGPVAAAGGRGR